MRFRAPALLWIGAVGLWGLVALSMANHWDDQIHDSLVGLAASTLIVAAVITVAGGNRQAIGLTHQEVSKLRHRTEADQILRDVDGDRPEVAQPAGQTVRVHRAVIDGEPMLIGTRADTTLDVNGVRHGLRRARR